MCTFPGFLRVLILPIVLFASVPFADAESAARLINKLDELDRDIVESRELSARTGNTIEELRKSLYQSAVKIRDVKKVGDEVDSAKSKDAEIKAQHELLRSEISRATASIRVVNNQLLELEKINAANLKRWKDFDEEIVSLKDSVVDPEKAAEAAGKKKIESLQSKLKEATDLLEQREEVIEKLNREVRKLSKSQPTVQPVVEPRVSTEVEKKLITARGLLDAGNVDGAIVLYNKLMYENPDSDEVRLGLAACYFERGELDTAQGLIDEVLSRDKGNAWALGLQGALFYRDGKLRDARRALEKSIKIDAANAYTHNYHGVVLFEMGNQENGIAAVQQALQLDPDFVPALYNLAVMMTSAGVPDLTAARFYYEKAISLGGPRDPLLDQLLNLTP